MKTDITSTHTQPQFSVPLAGKRSVHLATQHAGGNNNKTSTFSGILLLPFAHLPPTFCEGITTEFIFCQWQPSIDGIHYLKEWRNRLYRPLCVINTRTRHTKQAYSSCWWSNKHVKQLNGGCECGCVFARKQADHLTHSLRGEVELRLLPNTCGKQQTFRWSLTLRRLDWNVTAIKLVRLSLSEQ